MKKIVLIGITILLTLTSCEKYDSRTGPDVFFKIGRGKEFKFDDIQLYDSSTHILYLKEENNVLTELLSDSFSFLDKGDTIYAGIFVPGYSSFIPTGPMIPSPSMYGNHALRIEVGIDKKPDVRNCSRIIELLKEYNLLHSGLSGTVDFVEIIGTQLSFGFTIVNYDLTDLLIIDLTKTGLNLFHYFTNGLCLRDQNHNEVFSSNIVHQKPEPWNSWKSEWLSTLKQGDSKSFTINYTIETPINPGEYFVLFEFPGLAYQVSKDQLFQGNNRIWLGDITLRRKIAIP
jgi:hypothetical protein